jgi:integrase
MSVNTSPRNDETPQRVGPPTSNVKSSFPGARYERFGEAIRYLTVPEWNRVLDCVEDYRHKLMLRVLYELGCRVGEFVRIRLGDLDFGRSSVFIPAANTKTRQRRVSHLPEGLLNEIRSMLRLEGRMAKRTDQIHVPGDYLFHPATDPRIRYSENRIRQIFARYVRAAGLDRIYGVDLRGRRLHELTVHSLRHSHIMHYIHTHNLPLPIVQKQVGHKSLKATSVYLRPSDEHVGQAYAAVRHHSLPGAFAPQPLNSGATLSLEHDSTRQTRKRVPAPAGADSGHRRVNGRAS